MSSKTENSRYQICTLRRSGGVTVFKYNSLRAAAIIGGGAATSSFSYWWVYFLIYKWVWLPWSGCYRTHGWTKSRTEPWHFNIASTSIQLRHQYRQSDLRLQRLATNVSSPPQRTKFIQLGMDKREWSLNISMHRCGCCPVHRWDSITSGTAQLLSHSWTRCEIKWLSSCSCSTSLISSPQQFPTGFQLLLKLMMWYSWVM